MKQPPRVPIAALPTPVEELPRLSATLGKVHILTKRDDLTGLAFGGNKTRKLEFLLAEAQDQGARTLITCGSIQSNHARQTAAIATRAGMECILVLNGKDPAVPTANVLLDRLLGAETVWCERPERNRVLQETFEKAKKEGRKPFLIPLGGSTPTGAMGYVFAMQELADQKVQADWIIFPTSSGGTAAGILLGAKLTGFKGKILGISVDVPEDEHKEEVISIANRAAEQLGETVRINPVDFNVNDHYTGAGYGVMGAPEIEAIRLFARHEGVLVDPVYTGRAAAGMIDLIRKGFFKSGETLLFWHTGGTPALFADEYVSVAP